MKADTTYSASGVRKPYSTDPNRSRQRQYRQIAKGSPGTAAEPKDRPKVDPMAELIAKANKDASHAAGNCKILGNLKAFSGKLRQSMVLGQRLRPDQDSYPLHLIF